MSINVSSYIASLAYCTNSLSETTRRKLLALGIDPSTVTSEAEAKLLIENKQRQLQSVNKSDSAGGKTFCAAEYEVFTKAKQLAKKIGLSIKENSSPEEIIVALSNKINEMINADVEHAKDYKLDLDTIKADYFTLQQNQNSMFAMLNMNANVNKYILGL